MYHIATADDFNTLKNSYIYCSNLRKENHGLPMPDISDDELSAYIEAGKIIVSDFGSDELRSNICFDVTEDYIQAVWTIPNLKHKGDVGAMYAYLIMTYKKPLRYWVVGGTEREQLAAGGKRAANTVLIRSEVNEYGKTMNLYEFTAAVLSQVEGVDGK